MVRVDVCMEERVDVGGDEMPRLVVTGAGSSVLMQDCIQHGRPEESSLLRRMC